MVFVLLLNVAIFLWYYFCNFCFFVRYMPGLAEGMEGVKAGEKREIRITFPDKLGSQGGDLEGTKAIFEVEAVEVKVCAAPPFFVL